MSLFTMKHFINNLTTGMMDLVTMETVPSISFALGQMTTEGDIVSLSTGSNLSTI